jgi:hypothetical protein
MRMVRELAAPATRRALLALATTSALVASCGGTQPPAASVIDAGSHLDASAPVDAGEAADARAEDDAARRDDSSILVDAPGDASVDAVAVTPVEPVEPLDAGAASAPCMLRCVVRAAECGAPAEVATARCATLCEATPSEEELACVETLSCEAAACTEPALPCALDATDSLPLSTCRVVCIAAAERCGAPAAIAEARCDESCPLVERGEQLACLRDASCAALRCIEAQGERPCGIGGAIGE